MEVTKDPERSEAQQLLACVDVKGKRVLEIGCGDGRLTWSYASGAGRVGGIDLDRDALKVARIERPSDLEERVLFAAADSRRLPFPTANFDLAIFAWSF